MDAYSIGLPLVLFIAGLVVSAILLRAASSWVAKFDIPFGRSVLIALLLGLTNVGVWLAAGVVHAGLNALSRESGRAFGDFINVLTVVGAFVADAAIIAAFLKLRLGRAAGVVGVMNLLAVACILVVVVPITLFV